MTIDIQLVETTLQAHINDDSLELPVLPAVANQVIQLTHNPDVTNKELADLLQRDLALASHTMRFANSAAYSPVTKLVSLQQAIARLGMQTIAEIALASTLNAKLFKVPGYEEHAIEIWRHALATALWCKELARFTRRNIDTTFLAGLLHSIGRPVILQAVLKIAEDLNVTPTREQICDLEERFQREVGLKVCQQWQMPTLVQTAIEYLNNHQDAPSHNEQIAIVCGATSFARHMLDPDGLNKEQLCQLEIIEQLNLYEDEVNKLLDAKDVIKETLEAIS